MDDALGRWWCSRRCRIATVDIMGGIAVVYPSFLVDILWLLCQAGASLVAALSRIENGPIRPGDFMSKRRGGFRLTWPYGLAIGLALSLTTACTSLPIEIPPAENSFEGISLPLGDPSVPKPLHVLIIHGMGTQAPNQFDGFILALANRLRLVQMAPEAPAPAEPQPPECPEQAPAPPSGLVDPPPQFIGIDGVPSDAQARLYTYHFSSAAGGSTGSSEILSVSYLYWAPLTEAIKCKALKEAGAPQRQWFADVAKEFIDDALGDVVLYAGKYRDSQRIEASFWAA